MTPPFPMSRAKTGLARVHQVIMTIPIDGEFESRFRENRHETKKPLQSLESSQNSQSAQTMMPYNGSTRS